MRLKAQGKASAETEIARCQNSATSDTAGAIHLRSVGDQMEAASGAAIETQRLTKTFDGPGGEVRALDGVDIIIRKNEFCSESERSFKAFHE